MRVSIITPWGESVRGGLRTYSEHLIDGFGNHGDPITVDVTRLARYHDVDARYLEWLAEQAVRNDPDVVHVQHEGGRYGHAEGALFDALPDAVPVVTTVHSAAGLEEQQRRVLVERSEKVIVHTEAERDALDPYPKETPTVIPHGAVLRDPPAKPASAAALDLDHIPEFAVVTYGFLGPWKQVEQVIDAVHNVAGAHHVHCGEWHTSRPHGGYAAEVKQLAESKLPTRHQWPGYVADDDLPAVFGLADVAVYANAWASESGSMHEMLGAGVPVVARDVAPFDDDRPALLFDDQDGLEDHLRRLRDDVGGFQETLPVGGREWAKQRSWDEVAHRHRVVYDWVTNCEDPERYLAGERDRWRQTFAGYDGEYPDAANLHQAARMAYEYVCQWLDSPVLDVGCSVGRLPAFYSTRWGPPLEWYGVDILYEHAAAATDSGRYEEVDVSTADDLLADDGQYQTVVLSEVLEHCPNQREVLAEARRVCAPDGHVVVVMPTAERASLTDPWTLNPSELAEVAGAAKLVAEECTLLAGATGDADLVYKTVGAFTPTADDGADEAEGVVA